MKIRTWQFELTVVGLILANVICFKWILIGQGLIEIIGALAVLLTFAHVQVADRLAEKAGEEEARGEETVECHRWTRRYLIGKEVCWLIYFTALGA